MADSETTTRAKRKRSQISYDVEEYFEDLDMEEQAAVESDSSLIDNSDVEDVDFGTRKKPKKRAKKQPKPKKEKPFRFMDLPPELRDEIYDLALTDSEIAIVSHMRKHRRSADRGIITCETGPTYYGKKKAGVRRRWGYYSRSIRNPRDDRKIITLGHARKELIPNLLAVSKQIREEASSVLYKQELLFEDMTALFTFVTAIGPYNRQLLSDIVVKGYMGESPFNYAAFGALAGCTNIQSLFFDCDVGHGRGPRVARQIYHDGRFFLEAYGAANGAFDAAVDIIELAEERHFAKKGTGGSSGKEVEVDPKKIEQFEDMLRSMLEDSKPKQKRKGRKSRA